MDTSAEGAAQMREICSATLRPENYPPMHVPALRASGITLTLLRAHARSYYLPPLRGFRSSFKAIAVFISQAPSIPGKLSLSLRRVSDVKTSPSPPGIEIPGSIQPPLARRRNSTIGQETLHHCPRSSANLVLTEILANKTSAAPFLNRNIQGTLDSGYTT
jgi:hypothetical protein